MQTAMPLQKKAKTRNIPSRIQTNLKIFIATSRHEAARRVLASWRASTLDSPQFRSALATMEPRAASIRSS